jgi:hypothetical protein
MPKPNANINMKHDEVQSLYTGSPKLELVPVGLNPGASRTYDQDVPATR